MNTETSLRVAFANRAILKGDSHAHTTNSDGLFTPSKLTQAAISRGLDWIVITDHNLPPSPRMFDSARGGIKNLGKEGKFFVFPGIEMDIKHQGTIGHLTLMFSPQVNLDNLARVLIRLLDKGPDLTYMLQWARDNRVGLTIAHPYQSGLHGFPFAIVADALKDAGDPGAWAMEVVSGTSKFAFPSFMRLRNNYKRSIAAARAMNLAPIAASDTHQRETLGLFYTETEAYGPIACDEDMFESLMMSMVLKTTSPRNRFHTVSDLERTKVRLEIATNLLATMIGHADKNNPWDPYHGGRIFLRRTGQISEADYMETMEFKKEQQGQRRRYLHELQAEKEYARAVRHAAIYGLDEASKRKISWMTR